MTETEIEELIAENDKLNFAVKYFRNLYLKVREENLMLRQKLKENNEVIIND